MDETNKNPASLAARNNEIISAVHESGWLRKQARRTLGRYTATEDQIEDTQQNAVLKLLEFSRTNDLGALGGINAVKALVFRILKNHVIDLRRKDVTRVARGHASIDDVAEGDLADMITPDRCVQGQMELEGFVDALGGLPELTRDIYSLYVFEDKNREEIARQLGVSKNTVQNHLNKARDHIQRRTSE